MVSEAAPLRHAGCANGRTASPPGERRYKGAMRDWIGEAAEWRRELAAAVVVGLFLGAIGPFGTFLAGGLAVRLGYWVGISVVGLGLYSVVVRAALHWGGRWGQPTWFVLPLAVLAASIPMSVVSAAAVVAIWPSVRGHMRPFDWYAQAVVMSVPLSGLAVWTRRRFPVRPIAAVPSSDRVSDMASDPASDPSRFVDRLPSRLGRTLLCLQMEDHYVRAHTDRGSELVLLPLKAAMAELAGEGLQVHRSWWVARAAVTGPVWEGRNLKLKLVNGMEAPVSRASVAALRQAGWLDDPESNGRTAGESIR